jgi:hypothetical protein
MKYCIVQKIKEFTNDIPLIREVLDEIEQGKSHHPVEESK